MLGDHIAVQGQQGFRGLLFKGGVTPGIDVLYIDHSLGIDALHAQREGVDAAVHLGVVRPGSDIADQVRFGLQAGGDTGQIARLIDAAKVVVEVDAIVLIARAMGENNVGVFFGDFFHIVHVTPGVAEDDAAAGLNQLAQGVFTFGVLCHVKLVEDLLVLEAQGFLHAFNAVVVRAGEPVVLGADKYCADLDVSSRDRREGRLRRRWQGNHRQSEHQDE